MHALRDFFTTDCGLASAAVIAITLSMSLYFTRHAKRPIREDGERAAREAAGRWAAPSPALLPQGAVPSAVARSSSQRLGSCLATRPTRTAHGLTQLPCNGAPGHATARRQPS